MRKLISLITLVSFSIQAATITDDKLTVGKKSSASDKEIIFDTGDGSANKKIKLNKTNKKLIITSDEALIGDGTNSDKAITFDRGGSNAQVKWNELTDKLQFSNDGTTFKDLGTGGGGGGSTGVNVLTNDSFEDAVGGVITDWSNTGGTLTQETYTNSVEGDAKYFQFVATGAGQYFEMVKTVPTNFNGGGCQVDFKKLNIATADLFKVEALDASNNVLATGNVKISSWVKFPTLSFVCPAAGSTFKIRVTSLAAGTLQGDKAYLGSNQNIVNISQATLVGTIEWPATAGCNWAFPSSTSYVPPAVVAACPTPTVSGAVTAPAQKTPAFNLDAKAGTYMIVFNGALVNAGGNTKRYSWWDGTLRSEGSSNLGSAGSNTLSGFTSKMTYTSPGIKSINLQGLDEVSGGSTLYNDNASRFTSVQVYFFPAGQETAVSPEQSSWFIDANIGGGVISLGTAAVTSYTVPTEASLDLVLNTSKGSASAEIACASGTASSGLNCGASLETPGIAFIPPWTGLFEACFATTHWVDINPSSAINTTFQLIETSNTSTAIISEGGQRITSGISSGATTTVIPYMPNMVCGTFNFTDVSKKTIRLAYEQAVNNSVTFSRLPVDRSATDGQRDMKITIRPLLSAYNRPVLTGDQVINTGAVKPKICAFSFGGGAGYNTACTSLGACTIYQQGTSCGITVSKTSPGLYTYTSPASLWNGTNYFCGPAGFPTYISGTHTPGQYESSAKSNTGFFARFNNSTGDTDVAANIICYGIGN